MAHKFVFFLTVLLLISSCEMKRRKDGIPTEKQLELQRKETTPVDFTRLVVMRVVYGFAKVLGFEEPISEVLNGAFVPPGADDDDDFDDEGDDIFDY
ncbi:uncharacterized protein LOC132903182 [Amyelois transitella]|uniref:uncharacterized protein LOC132903182 n=1 Tax=Amyelois transitella TaxID=680683 RepID=UPI002990032E|nr:uncharacterized protein LOC132903182 [Amyelois transitella]